MTYCNYWLSLNLSGQTLLGSKSILRPYCICCLCCWLTQCLYASVFLLVCLHQREAKAEWVIRGSWFLCVCLGPAVCKCWGSLGKKTMFLPLRSLYNIPPLICGDTFQDLSGCLKLQIVPNSIYTMFFPIYAYLFRVYYKLGTVQG